MARTYPTESIASSTTIELSFLLEKYIFPVFLKMSILTVLKDFARTTSIHGLCYLVRPDGTRRSKIGWALVFLAAVLYASLELRLEVFSWYTHPVKSVVVTIPIEKVEFPAVTLCPYNSSPDRWGTAIKIFDHMKIKCLSKR